MSRNNSKYKSIDSFGKEYHTTMQAIFSVMLIVCFFYTREIFWQAMDVCLNTRYIFCINVVDVLSKFYLHACKERNSYNNIIHCFKKIFYIHL